MSVSLFNTVDTDLFFDHLIDSTVKGGLSDGLGLLKRGSIRYA